MLAEEGTRATKEVEGDAAQARAEAVVVGFDRQLRAGSVAMEGGEEEAARAAVGPMGNSASSTAAAAGWSFSAAGSGAERLAAAACLLSAIRRATCADRRA